MPAADGTHNTAGREQIALLRQTNITMSVLFILIGASLLVAGGFLAAFLWAVRKGQYDDDYTPSVRMLFEDEQPPHDQPTKR